MLSRPSRGRRWSAAAVAVAVTLTVVPGAAAQQTSEDVRDDLGRAEDRLDQIDEQLGLVVELYNTAQVALDEVTARLAATHDELGRLRDEQTRLADVVGDHVRRMHKMGPALELSTVVFAGDPTEAGVKSWAMARILDNQRTDLEALDTNRIELHATESRMQEEQQQAESRAQEQEQARVEVEAMFARTKDEVAELTEQQEADHEHEVASAESSSPSPAPPPEPKPGPTPAPSTRQSADIAVQTAVAQLGKPYQWGGGGPNGFDCSGLTSFAWRAAGVTIPRTSGTQFSDTERITSDQLQPGDLVFYYSPISHVAMYIGNGQVVEAPNSGSHVRIRNDGTTRRGIVGYGRP